jgi:hypothetical protein
MTKIIGIIFGISMVVLLAAVGSLYLYFGPEPVLVDPDATLDDVEIQPSEALALAQPYIEQYGTYRWKEDGELRRYIVRQKDWYFISETDYPAKTLRFYMGHAVKVHAQTGEVRFSQK